MFARPFRTALQTATNRTTSATLTQRCFSSTLSYGPKESAILSAALSHVPSHGFTDASLLMGVKDAGYLDITTNVFPQGAFEIAKYHMVNQREQLKKFGESPEWQEVATAKPGPGMTRKLRALCIQRLQSNGELIRRWPEAVALMKYPSNLESSASELFNLSDLIWTLAGDSASGTSWYTKRASLSGVYAATEVYMTKDNSPGYTNTWDFLDQRMKDALSLGATVGRVGSYLDYARYNVVNVLRSKGVRI